MARPIFTTLFYHWAVCAACADVLRLIASGADRATTDGALAGAILEVHDRVERITCRNLLLNL